MGRGFLLPFIAFILGICLIGVAGKRSPDKEAVHRFLPPPSSVEHLVAGYRDISADMFWLRFIQDADHCDEGVKPGQPCQSDKGWAFLMLDAITKLAPQFMAPYEHGATILSVLVGDIEGARVIFERGMVEFPNDWQLQYRAAYHMMERMGNIPEAADLLVRAAQNGAPAWVLALAAKLYTKEGQAILAKSVLEAALASDPESRWSARLRERLDEINRSLPRN